MSRRCWAVTWLGGFCAALLLGGCGYSHGGLYPDQYRTVAVPIFENRTFYRQIEYDLSEALVKELELATPYTVAPPGEADTVLAGTIRNIEQTMLSRRRLGGVPQEMEVTLTIDLEWRDLRTGEAVMTRRGLPVVARYVPTAPVDQPFEVGQHALAQQLAREIVAELRGQW